MGANCCVPVRRDKHIFINNAIEVESVHRNIRCSPSWSIRWDNRTHIEDIMDGPSRFHNTISENVSSEIKSGGETETEVHSDEGSPTDASHTPKGHNSPIKLITSVTHKAGAADQSIGRNSTLKEKDSKKSPALANTLDPNLSIPLPSTPSSSTSADPSSSRSRFLPCDSYPRNKIPSQRSLDENGSSLEGTHSFPRHISSNDVANGGSQGGGSSDGWSMRTFSELVASSQRERWSVDSGNLSSKYSKSAISDAQSSLASPSIDREMCGVCTTPLKGKPNGAPDERCIIAVLVCGHAYHAECLESKTPADERFDPSCPICVYGENFSSKPLGRKAKNRISKRAVVGIDTNGDGSEELKSAEKAQRVKKLLRGSSSMKSAFSRHFSIGPRPTRSISDNESTRKKGFWARYRRNG